MTAQLSPLRRGRITGSRIAGILGLSKYESRDDVMRVLVRDFFGAEPEFTGNTATEYGNAHEEDARADYERATGRLVLDAQDFVIHPEFDWLGVSPDGLVGDDGMVEIKCPMRAHYTSVSDVPHYGAQIQAQLACTGRAWCDFIIWRSFEQADRLGVEPLVIERVDADPDWLPPNLARLAEFHSEFLEIVGDEKRAEPFLTDPERTDDAWVDAAAEFAAAETQVMVATARLDAAKDHLRELAGERSARGAGVSVCRTERRGSVDYSKAVKKYAPEADLEEFRKASSTVWTVRSVAQ